MWEEHHESQPDCNSAVEAEMDGETLIRRSGLELQEAGHHIKGPSEEVTAMVQMKDICCSDQSGDGEKRSDSGCILQREMTAFC